MDRNPVRARIARFFALDDPWERPGGLDWGDLVTGAGTLALAAAFFLLAESLGSFQHVEAPAPVQWLAVVIGGLLLVWRRRYPLTVAVLAAVHLFTVGILMTPIMGTLAMQIIYFAAFYSGAAWARSRRDMLVTIGAITIFMFGWLTWTFALGRGIDQIREGLGDDVRKTFGPLSPLTAYLLLTGLVNLLFFGGATLLGQVAWRSARQRARLAEQARLLTAQGEELRERAVLGERLRIARELHDVVAHHVSVIGISAAAARRVLDRDPQAAATALGSIEESSREAVTQMRGLVGTLRTGEPAESGTTRVTGGTGSPSRAPEPGLDALPALVAGFSEGSPVTAAYELVDHPAGAAAEVPPALALTVYRTAQEALTNIRRHSTASRATVVVRVERAGPAPHVEIEVTDDGRPRHGTSGSGLGQLGIRERAASHHGTVDIGPRVTGGYRVRVRLPLAAASAGAPGTWELVP